MAHGGKAGAVPIDGIPQESRDAAPQQHQPIEYQQRAKAQVQTQNPFQSPPPLAVAGGPGKGQTHTVSGEKHADTAGLNALDPMQRLCHRKPDQEGRPEYQPVSHRTGHPTAESRSQKKHGRDHRVSFHPGPGNAVAPILQEKIATQQPQQADQASVLHPAEGRVFDFFYGFYRRMFQLHLDSPEICFHLHPIIAHFYPFCNCFPRTGRNSRHSLPKKFLARRPYPC